MFYFLFVLLSVMHAFEASAAGEEGSILSQFLDQCVSKNPALYNITYLCHLGDASRSFNTVYKSCARSLKHIDRRSSLHESNGLIDTDWCDWQMRVLMHWEQYQYNVYTLQKGSKGSTQWFYQNTMEPTIDCEFEERFGVRGDGGKWICNPGVAMKKDDCLVYSIGSNRDDTFERAISERFGCEIHTYDHTIGNWQPNPPISNHTMHAKGFGSPADVKNYPSQLLSLHDMIVANNHIGRKIDVFKIDCEGCEWNWMKDLATYTDCDNIHRKAFDSIMQLQIEVHNKAPPGLDLASLLNHLGLVLFHKEPNIGGCKGTCVELSFMRLDIPQPNFDKDFPGSCPYPLSRYAFPYD